MIDHHAAQGLVHARLHHAASTALERSRAEERGQGSVEYVALVLLVAGVLATAVVAAKKADLQLASIIASKIKGAIEQVSGAKG